MALGDELITLSNVRQYRDVDTQYDPVRFSAFLKEVQEHDLKELLGDALWLNFFENITDINYATLLNGVEYTYNNQTILYSGLKPFLVWAWLAKLPLEGNLHHTQSGDVSYLRDITASPSKSVMNQALENYKQNKLVERNKIIQFLNTNPNTYPLWESDYQQNTTNLQFDII